MRVTQIKIGPEKKDAVLVAGGPGFKIYSPNGSSGWALTIGRKVFMVEEKDAEFKAISRYINLRYQPRDQQQAIKDEFDSIIKAKSSPISPTIQNPDIVA